MCGPRKGANASDRGLSAMGYEASNPLTESAAYDLVVSSCQEDRRSVTLRDADKLGAVAESG